MSYNHNSQNSYLNKYPRMYNNSSEWIRLEYLLQLSLGSTTVAI